mmetsp:Transcript_4474/g.14332  ORF Transcript_4474/g.14332 Transcript_4474/m.14332 type:complete len:202 (-) Transcript_4474:1299-1904(-)
MHRARARAPKGKPSELDARPAAGLAKPAGEAGRTQRPRQRANGSSRPARPRRGLCVHGRPAGARLAADMAMDIVKRLFGGPRRSARGDVPDAERWETGHYCSPGRGACAEIGKRQANRPMATTRATPDPSSARMLKRPTLLAGVQKIGGKSERAPGHSAVAAEEGRAYLRRIFVLLALMAARPCGQAGGGGSLRRTSTSER